MYYIYILNCSDNKLYVGCTQDLKDRVQNRHKKGLVPATRSRLPLKLIAYIAIDNKYKAYKMEKYLKSGSGRVFLNRHVLEGGVA